MDVYNTNLHSVENKPFYFLTYSSHNCGTLWHLVLCVCVTADKRHRQWKKVSLLGCQFPVVPQTTVRLNAWNLPWLEDPAKLLSPQKEEVTGCPDLWVLAVARLMPFLWMGDFRGLLARLVSVKWSLFACKNCAHKI